MNKMFAIREQWFVYDIPLAIRGVGVPLPCVCEGGVYTPRYATLRCRMYCTITSRDL
jgi:hypothetical protein